MKKVSLTVLAIFSIAILFTFVSMTMDKKEATGAYLEITLDIKDENRTKAAGVYIKYKQPFLKEIEGATSKELLLRTDDVQVLHGFETEAAAKAYLSSDLFAQDVVSELKPYLQANPEIRIYSVFK
jgi:hypothetical protein